VLELLGLETVPVDGTSLVPWLAESGGAESDARLISIESGFSVPSIQRGNPDAAEAFAEGVRYYEITRDGRLVISDKWMDELLSQKQRAVVLGDWALAAYPASLDGDDWHLVLADLRASVAWNARDDESVPAAAPLDALRDGLCERFGGARGFDLPECRER